MSKIHRSKMRRSRRSFTEEFKSEAVQMMLDGHKASSVSERLGVGSVQLLYRWKAQLLRKSSPAMSSLDTRVRELEAEVQRLERERDILKKALTIFSQRT